MENINVNEVELNGVKYIRKDSVKENQLAPEKDGLKWVMVRTYSAGVHYGLLKERNGKEVILLDSVRVWYWSGAASISQLASEGTIKPTECKFAIPLNEITLTEAIEIIPMTTQSINNLNSVKKWKL